MRRGVPEVDPWTFLLVAFVSYYTKSDNRFGNFMSFHWTQPLSLRLIVRTDAEMIQQLPIEYCHRHKMRCRSMIWHPFIAKYFLSSSRILQASNLPHSNIPSAWSVFWSMKAVSRSNILNCFIIVFITVFLPGRTDNVIDISFLAIGNVRKCLFANALLLEGE